MLFTEKTDFQRSVDRLKSSFKDFQSTLNEIKQSPLNLTTDFPLINLWLNEKSINALINSFCVPIECSGQNTLRPEDLEEYKVNPKSCKVEFDEHGAENYKRSNYKIKKEAFQNSVEDSHESQGSSLDQENSTSRKEYKRGPYKNYTVEQKMQAVRMLVQDHCSVIQISRKLHIPCKNIKRWSQQGVERKKGGGRKRFSPETEWAVSDYLKKQYEKGTEVPYEEVQKVARMLSEDASFKASRGWVVKFVDRQALRSYYKFV